MLANLYDQRKRVASNGGFTKALAVTTAGTTQDVLAPKVAGLTLVLQKVIISVQQGAAQTVQLRAKTTTAQKFSSVVSLATAGTVVPFDFGPDGVRLPAGETLEADISAAGAAFTIHVEGYYA